MSSLAERIRIVRTESQGHKLSMAAFAQKINVSPSAVSQWETGDKNPSKVYIHAIASEFGVNETWLLTGDGSMHDALEPEDEMAQLAASLYGMDPDGWAVQMIRKLTRLAEVLTEDEMRTLAKVAEIVSKSE